MAMFRHHISVGAIIAMIGVVVVFFYSLMVEPLSLGILFALAVFGSVLPDFDSDSGLPFYLTFGAATLAFTGVVMYYTLSHQQVNNYVLVGVPVVALLGFWFIVGGLVKHCTHHRGIWHSAPMMAISAIVTYLLSLYFGQPEMTALLFGAAMGAGFLSHLVLDEVWANVDHDGNPFTYKRSLGTAMKFFSDSRKVNVLTYVILAGLIYIALNPAVVLV